jgi:hypothetical protein
MFESRGVDSWLQRTLLNNKRLTNEKPRTDMRGSGFIHTSGFSTSFASPQSHCLSVLLQLRYQRIALLNYVCILFVLVIWPVCLDDPVNSIDCACNPVACDEFGKISVNGDG